eukprot:TRINITY_DN1210_c0_g1_i2.p1 TRINITY_DN1210_c0_g1~~TRINITY_DN1210_c0_g1_i2.p1  ORF type:complete len:288 (+),score=92.14 TRINITY_DN1210_c0_g1_i2:67-930(+)
MGAGGSVDIAKATEASQEDVAAVISGLSDDVKAKILAALKQPTNETSATNTEQVKQNKAAIHMLNSVVMGNKQKIYAERAFIEENRALILKNYSAAFMGNRQMANQNTEDIFKNRRAIVKSIKPVDAVQENFKNSRLNEAEVDFLEHRAAMNSRVVAVNEKMAEINKQLIEVNSMIMEGNAEIVSFNSKHLEINRQLLDGELTFEKATPESNAERIEKNTKRIQEISSKANENAEKHAKVLEAAKANREQILQNSQAIYERRAEIEANHCKIAENAGKISALITSSS